MIKTIQTFFTSFLISILFVQPSIAGNILYGTIRSDKWESRSYLNNKGYIKSCENFPMQLYEFNPKAYDLKYDDQVPQKDRVKDLSIFFLNPSASLKLISFEKTTGVTKFKLNLTGGDWLSFTGRGRGDGALFETGGTALKGGGSLKLANGENPEFIIEGKLETLNDQTRWISFNSNKYFDIKIETFFNCKNEVSLIRLQDIPVIVSS